MRPPLYMTMKSSLLLSSVLGLLPLPLLAQVTVVPTPVPGAVVVVQAPPSVVVRSLDPVTARSQLSIAPKVVILSAPAVAAPAVPPVEVLKTTKTTTVVETPGRPTRVYNSERNVVVIEEQNQTRELPYVTLPVLFVKETAELLDAESRSALEQMAGVILEVSKTEPGTLFDIEPTQAAAQATGAKDYAFVLDKAARGLGKTVWWGPFKLQFYGQSAPG